MTYEKEVEELEVCGFLCHVRVRGGIDYDDGKVTAHSPSGGVRNYQALPDTYSHDGYETVELFLNVSKTWRPLPKDLADSVYEAFCNRYPAEDLAEEFAEEPDYKGKMEDRRERLGWA